MLRLLLQKVRQFPITKAGLTRVARCHRLAKTRQVKPKCNEMRIHVLRKQQAIRQDLRIGDLKVGEDEIKRVRKTKYLGLTIDETLSWNQQYKIVKGKLKGGLDSIRKLRQLIPLENSITTFSSIPGIGGKSPQIW